MKKKFYRDSDGVIGGVCAGLANYLGGSTDGIRVITVILALAGIEMQGFNVVLWAYLITWALTPSR